MIKALFLSLYFFTGVIFSQTDGERFARPIDTRLLPYVLTLDELSSQSNAGDIYESLRRRFDNNNFDETLFPGGSIVGPRFSKLDSRDMLHVLKAFFSEYDSDFMSKYLQEKPPFESFLIPISSNQNLPYESSILNFAHAEYKTVFHDILMNYNDSHYLKLFNPEQIDWILERIRKNKKFESLSLQDLVSEQLSLNHELLASLLSVLKNMRNEPSRQAAAEILSGVFLQSLFDKSGEGLQRLDSFGYFLLYQEYLYSMTQWVSDHKLPGQMIHKFQEYFRIPQIANPLRGSYAVIPMSRFDAVYKGIGVGECIRCSGNRYLDAFYPSSYHFSILKNGKEIGYVGIYRTQIKGQTIPVWYIDVIQSPHLVDAGGEDRVLQTILLKMQEFALREGSLLAVAPKDWNAINYKENTNMLEKAGKILKVEVAFLKNSMLTKIFDFVKHKVMIKSRDLMFRSGYKSHQNIMYDSLLRNNYKVLILGPHKGVSNDQLKRMLSILALTYEAPPFLQGDSEIERFFILSAFPRSTEIQEQMFQIYSKKYPILVSLPRLKELSFSKLYPNISQYTHEKDQLNSDFITKMIRHILKLKSSNQQMMFITELVYLTRTSDEVLQILNSFEFKSRYAMSVLSSNILPVLDRQGFKNWIQIFADHLKESPANQTDMFFGIEILKRLENLEDLIEFSKHATGKASDKKMSIPEERDIVIVEHFKRLSHQKNTPFPELLEKGTHLLNLVKSVTDIKIRSILLQKAQTLTDISNVILASHPPDKSYYESYVPFIHHAVERVLNSNPNFTNEDVTLVRSISILSASANESYMNFLFKIILPLLEKDASTDWIQIFKTQLEWTYTNDWDLKLAQRVAPHIEGLSQAITFVKIMYGQVKGRNQKGHVGHPDRAMLGAEVLLRMLPLSQDLNQFVDAVDWDRFLDLSTLAKRHLMNSSQNFSDLWRVSERLGHEHKFRGEITDLFVLNLQRLLNKSADSIPIKSDYFLTQKIQWNKVIERLTLQELQKLDIALRDWLLFLNSQAFSRDTKLRIRIVLEQKNLIPRPIYNNGVIRFIEGLFYSNNQFKARNGVRTYYSLPSISLCQAYFL